MSRSVYLKVAYSIRGSQCPVCRELWLCAEDIRTRQPLFKDGEVICMLCAKQLEGLDHDEVARQHLRTCLEHAEAEDCFFTDSEDMAVRCLEAKLRVGRDLDDGDCETLYHLYISLVGLDNDS